MRLTDNGNTRLVLQMNSSNCSSYNRSHEKVRTIDIYMQSLFHIGAINTLLILKGVLGQATNEFLQQF